MFTSFKDQWQVGSTVANLSLEATDKKLLVTQNIITITQVCVCHEIAGQVKHVVVALAMRNPPQSTDYEVFYSDICSLSLEELYCTHINVREQ